MKTSHLPWLLFAAVTTGQLGACALVSRGETLNIRYYTLDDRGAGHATPSRSELALRLGRVDASGGLGEQIAVRTGAYEISYREDQRWTERPAQFVRRELERALFRERGLTRSYSGHTPQLEVELIELELVESGEQAQARVRMTAQIRDDKRSLCQDNFEAQLPISGEAREDMEQSVAALSSALHRTVEQVATRAVECLSAAAEQAASSAPARARDRQAVEQSPDPSLANAEQ